MSNLFRYDEDKGEYIEQTLSIEKFGELLNLLQQVANEENEARMEGYDSALSDGTLAEIEATLAITRAESTPL